MDKQEGLNVTKKTKATKTKPKAKAVEFRTDVALVEVPVLETNFPCPARVDVELTRRQAKAMRFVFDGLQHKQAKVMTSHKRPVKHHADVLRYMLDMVADEIKLPAAV